MKSFVALSALVLAVCVVTSQCKPTGNTNINQNKNRNSNFDFISSFLSSVLSQQRKAKAAASRAIIVESPVTATTAQPITETQQDNQQATDEAQTPADEAQTPADDSVVGVASMDEAAPRSEPQQAEPQEDNQFKFIQALMAQDF